MKTRLVIFFSCLLVLPEAGYWIGGLAWPESPSTTLAEIVNPPATLLTTLLLFGYILLTNHLVKLISGSNPLNAQRNYFVWVGASGAILVWSLTYLNLFAGNWVTQPENMIMQLLLYTPLFMMLAPAVLGTRAVLGSLPGVLKYLSHGIAMPVCKAESTALVLTAIAVAGLSGGAVWPEQLFWLMWLAPLSLLIALQLLWHESTLFSGLTEGDWGRVSCAALSGIIVANLTLLVYRANGGILEINLPHPIFAQAGYAVFGMMCLQLGDVIAENWRGKKRGTQFQQKKKFPIPIVAGKN